MTALAWLVPLALLLGGIGLAAFLWRFALANSRTLRRSLSRTRGRASQRFFQRENHSLMFHCV